MKNFLYVIRIKNILDVVQNHYFQTDTAYEILKKHEPNITPNQAQKSIQRARWNGLVSKCYYYDKKTVDGVEQLSPIGKIANILYFSIENVKKINNLISEIKEEDYPLYAKIYLLENKEKWNQGLIISDYHNKDNIS